MASGLTSPAGDELERLRQQYDRLCDLMTRTAESDPAAAERVLAELQTLSERILTLEAGRADRPAAAPAEPPTPPSDQPPAPPPGSPPGSPEAAAARPAEPSPAAERRPEAAPARIVAFRVTPSIGQRPADSAAKSTPASWRVDAPPTATARPNEPDAPSAPAPLPQAPAQRAEPAAPAPAAPAASRAAPPQLPPRAPPGPIPAPNAARAQPAAEPHGNATLFTSAMRQWLERHRSTVADDAAAPAPPGRGSAAPVRDPAPTPPDPPTPRAATGASPREPQPLSRIAAAIEQQALQIERILALCEAHQHALERLEARIEARLERPLQTPPAADPELPELRAAVEEQRQRVTALAKTIHNLAQWLATQRGLPQR